MIRILNSASYPTGTEKADSATLLKSPPNDPFSLEGTTSVPIMQVLTSGSFVTLPHPVFTVNSTSKAFYLHSNSCADSGSDRSQLELL